MPDNDSSGSIEKNSEQHDPGSQAVDPQVSPDNPHSETGQSGSAQEVQREVQEIEDRVKRAERWMIGLTFAIALFGLCAVVVGILQWAAMRGQLGEMKSGGADTHDLAVAAKAQSEQAVAQTKAMGAALLRTDKLIKATSRVAIASNDANRLAIENIRGRVLLQRCQLLKPIVVGQTVILNCEWKNVGHSPIIWSSGQSISRWRGMPSGDMPVEMLEGGILNSGESGNSTLTDLTPISTTFLKGIPTTMSKRPDLSGYETIYFYGRISYATIGQSYFTDFCTYIWYLDPDIPGIDVTGITTGYSLRQCPKWHTVDYKKQ